jgi:uncharacterized protein with FMN-binding domain
MRRLALLLAATAVVVALAVTLRPHDKPAASAPPAPPPKRSTPSGTTEPTPPYRSGTATGKAAHTDYGDVRVKVTVSHHRIVQVEALELPHGNPVDLQLSKPAARTLERWVVKAQSTDVDTVSGATYTSTGYLISLQSALDQLGRSG